MSLLKNLIATVIVLGFSSAYSAETAVSFQDAPKYYNQTKTVEGTIANAFCNDKMCFLNFDKDYRKYLSAVIMSADFAKFSKATGKDLQTDLEKTYAGKKVQITGALTEYKGKETDKPGRPQISLTATDKIKIVK